MLKILKGESNSLRCVAENCGKEFVPNGWCRIYIVLTTNWYGDWEDVRREALCSCSFAPQTASLLNTQKWARSKLLRDTGKFYSSSRICNLQSVQWPPAPASNSLTSSSLRGGTVHLAYCAAPARRHPYKRATFQNPQQKE